MLFEFLSTFMAGNFPHLSSHAHFQFIKKHIKKTKMSSSLLSYFASNTNAITPAASGADAEVPLNSSVQP